MTRDINKINKKEIIIISINKKMKIMIRNLKKNQS